MLLAASVVFSFLAPNAKLVQFAGDLTSWDHPAKLTQKAGIWSYKTNLPADARVEYKFIVDGSWTLDLAAPRTDNGVGGENNVWQGPQYKIDIPDGQPQHPMTRLSATVEGYKVALFVPLKVSPDTPLLAYADGDTYESRGKVQNVVENLAEQGKIPASIVLLVTPKDREQDYWHKSPAAEDVFIHEILPWTYQQTGQSPDPKRVYVGGSSLGGVFALRLAEDYPDIIGGGLHSQSGAFWVEKEDISRAVLDRLPKGFKAWLDYGSYERELTEANKEAMKNLRSEKVECKSLVTPEGHNWTAWRHRMVAGLLYLLGSAKA
jgi:enterochelin esterase-like enzyme